MGYRDVTTPEQFSLEELRSITKAFHVLDAKPDRVTFLLSRDPFRNLQLLAAGSCLALLIVVSFVAPEPHLFLRVVAQTLLGVLWIQAIKMMRPASRDWVTIFPGYNYGIIRYGRLTEVEYLPAYGAQPGPKNVRVKGDTLRKRWLASPTHLKRAVSALRRVRPENPGEYVIPLVPPGLVPTPHIDFYLYGAATYIGYDKIVFQVENGTYVRGFLYLLCYASFYLVPPWVFETWYWGSLLPAGSLVMATAAYLLGSPTIEIEAGTGNFTLTNVFGGSYNARLSRSCFQTRPTNDDGWGDFGLWLRGDLYILATAHDPNPPCEFLWRYAFGGMAAADQKQVPSQSSSST